MIRSVTYPGIKKERYTVDEYGHIFDLKRNKYMRQTKTKKDYLAVKLNKESGGRKYVFVHRIVAYEFLDGYDDDKFVNHKNGKRKWLNHFSNLEWVTHQENMTHAFQTGLFNNKKK
jgi:hypothetical protein